MNEQPSEVSFRVERLPKDVEPPQHPRAYVIDARGVMRYASEAEAWLWDELERTRANLDAALEMGRGAEARTQPRRK